MEIHMSLATRIESQAGPEWSAPIPKNEIRDSARTLIAVNIVMRREGLQALPIKAVADRHR
jgi:hypothetical protein